jgi:serine/threonine protein kinase
LNWPLSQDYNEAIQNPATSFADPLLRRGAALLNNLGLPLPRSGNFADVYPFRDSTGRLWALKCFTRPVSDLPQRYAAIDRHLQRYSLPFTVGFRFHPRGIRIRGQWFPLLQMDWVDGVTLDEFIRRHGQSSANLEALFRIWVRLCRRLRQSDVAHGDLQHGNVMLVPSSQPDRLGLMLIDYDGMWVPELARRPPAEIGHPHYQHPARAEGYYGPDIDRFPHLVIACALRALIVGGYDLWRQHDTGDHLLFRDQDFTQPEQSALLRQLWTYDDPILSSLLGHMILAARKPISETPWLDHLLVNAETLALDSDQRHEVGTRLGLQGPISVTTPGDEENVFAAIRWDDPPSLRQPESKTSSWLWLIAVAAILMGLLMLLVPTIIVILKQRKN